MAIRLIGFRARGAGFIDNVLAESLGGTFDKADVPDTEVNAGGRRQLKTVNFYTPAAYRRNGEPLPSARPS